MADIDLKTSTPDTSLPTTGFLFGADSQAASVPSVYSAQTVATTLLGPTTPFNASITADAPVLNLAQTWNDGGTTFTGLRFNAAGTSDANSASASLLMDLQVGGASRLKVFKSGVVSAAWYIATGAFGIANNNGVAASQTFDLNYNLTGLTLGSAQPVAWWSLSTGSGTRDLFLTRRAAANLRLGAADAAAPVAQTLSVQSVVAGTSNTAGANLTITGSQGTGTGAGGSIIFQVAPAGGTGNTPNGLVDALTIGSNRVVTVAANASNIAQIAMADRGTILSMYTAAFGTQPLRVEAPGGVSIENTTGAYLLGASDTRISRDAAAILGVRGGSSTAPAALSLYTYGASPPAAPAASIVRIYADTSGAKIRLMAIFPSGVAQQIAIEP